MMKKARKNTSKKQDLVQQRREQVRAQAGSHYKPSYIQRLPRMFTAEQMVNIIREVDAHSEVGTTRKVVNNTRKADEVRRSLICWLDRKKHEWLYDNMWEIAKEGNKLYGYDIKPIREQIQVSVYDESQEGFYAWHMDVDPDFMGRKISISVPLNHPAQYEGGELQFWDGGSIVTATQAPGLPILFPSWIVHRVNPVTSGRRYSMVCWIGGPEWS